MYFLIFLAVLADIGTVLSAKWTLAKQRLGVEEFNSLHFWILAIFSALTLWSLGYWDRAGALSLKYILLFGAMVVTAWAWNWLHTRALKNETLDRYEIIWMTIPIFTIIFSVLFLSEERDWRLFTAALVVSLTLIMTHLKQHHLDFRRYDRWLVLAVILIALEAVIIKALLSVWSPAALYFARTLTVALVFTLIHPPQIRTVTKAQWQGILGVGFFGAIYKIIQYTGYDKLGVVLTTMILVLSPFLTLLLDKLVLKEKFHFKYILGMLVIGLTIGWVLLG